jgi:hypothetical protein
MMVRLVVPGRVAGEGVVPVRPGFGARVAGAFAAGRRAALLEGGGGAGRRRSAGAEERAVGEVPPVFGFGVVAAPLAAAGREVLDSESCSTWRRSLARLAGSVSRRALA